ncbi:MAG: glycosyltransferase family 4 protein [Polyangiaceae bacterium]|nr:glycosyltransferase family 4 protein [Polyangiaceae bacterium]
MHIVWVNTHGSLVGGAEHYVRNTANLLGRRGVRSTLLYDPNLPTSSAMLDTFESAFPIVNIDAQLKEVKPDIVFVHQIRPNITQSLTRSPVPVINFLHDHFLFCLREHKYTAIGKRTCNRTVSASACYPCLGFVLRAPTFPRFRLRTVSDVIAAQDAHKQFCAFVTASRYMAEQAIAHGFDPARIHVAPLYAEKPGPEHSTYRDNAKLLYVGGVLRNKGLDVLLRALRNTVFPVRLEIIGDGAWMTNAHMLAHELGIHDRVSFLGRKPQHELREHYRRANCLVVPSRWPEPFGLVGVEAMSHGTPVIASAVGGILEWLVPGQTGLAVPPNDHNALAAAIDQLIGNPKLARSMGEAARARYLERFLPDHHIERLMGIFADVIKRGARS